MYLTHSNFKTPLLLLISFFVLLFSSCTNTIEEEAKSQPEDQKTLTLADYAAELDKNATESKFKVVEDFDGKTVEDFYNEWKRTNDELGRHAICGDAPTGCDFSLETGSDFVGSCEFGYSYELYDCGFGNVGIYNFEYWKIGGNCFAYEFLVEKNLEDGDLAQYQEGYNFFASVLLSRIEDDLITSIETPNETWVFFSYLSNICSVQCLPNGFQEECGEDCCLRFSVSQFGKRSVDVFGYGLCAGTTGTCTNTNQGPCESVDCRYLNVYR